MQAPCTNISRHSIPYATLHVVPYLFNDRARHRFDAPILLRDIINSRVSGQRNLYARAHQDIRYQRVKMYIFILSHLGGFNKRVQVAQIFSSMKRVARKTNTLLIIL